MTTPIDPAGLPRPRRRQGHELVRPACTRDEVRALEDWLDLNVADYPTLFDAYVLEAAGLAHLLTDDFVGDCRYGATEISEAKRLAEAVETWGTNECLLAMPPRRNGRTHRQMGCDKIAETGDHLLPMVTNEIRKKRLREDSPGGRTRHESQWLGSNHRDNVILACHACNGHKKHLVKVGLIRRVVALGLPSQREAV